MFLTIMFRTSMKWENCISTLFHFPSRKEWNSQKCQWIQWERVSYKYASTIFELTQYEKIDVLNIFATDIIARKAFDVFSNNVCNNITFFLLDSHKDKKGTLMLTGKAIYRRLESTKGGLLPNIIFILQCIIILFLLAI